MDRLEASTPGVPGDMKMLNTGKAGMENVDVQRANEIILQASKGSNFYLRQQEKQKEIAKRVQEMKENLGRFSEEQRLSARHRMDALAATLEYHRDLSHVIVHIDMDAFYASVEMRDDPSLTLKPMAVGSSHMLSTSNYHARKFGVRAAMPGFIAKKLCPELIIVPLNFEKYTSVSEEVRAILGTYDPQCCPMGLDEAYVDITTLVDQRQRCNTRLSREDIAQEIVSEIRQKIQEKTNLTASAGISPNKMLAKIFSNINKPNGQFLIEFEREKIMSFIQNLPIGKVCGIGGVTERLLNALDVQTCGDLWKQRGVLPLLFSELSATHFLRISLGLGSTCVPSDDVRKSMSVERTFMDTGDLVKLRQKCEDLCAALSKDLKKECLVGKTVTLKLKTSTFHVKTKAKSLTRYTSGFDIINSAAKLLLEQEMKNQENLQLRLMGVRMSTLLCESEVVGKQQYTMDDFLRRDEITSVCANDEEFVCPICGTKQTNLSAITRHVEQCLESSHSIIPKPEEKLDETIKESVSNLSTEVDGEIAGTSWMCPVCNRQQGPSEDIAALNQHVDDCLNMKTIREVLNAEKGTNDLCLKRTLPTKGLARKKSRNDTHTKCTSRIDKYLKSPC